MILKIAKLIHKIENKFLFYYWKSIVPKLIKDMGVNITDSVLFYGMPIIRKCPDSTIQIGNSVVLCSSSKFTDLGVNHPVILRTLNPNAYLSIGKNTGISGATICCAESITIGENCLFGANVTIVDTDFHPINPVNRRYSRQDIKTASVKIFDNVFLGANSMVLKGVTIGETALLGLAQS